MDKEIRERRITIQERINASKNKSLTQEEQVNANIEARKLTKLAGKAIQDKKSRSNG